MIATDLFLDKCIELSDRIDVLENKLSAEAYVKLNDKIIELQRINDLLVHEIELHIKLPLNNRCTELEERMDKLENQIENINDLSDEVKRSITILQHNDGRKSYECHVCKGCGMKPNPLQNLHIDNKIDCPACEGKGVLWG